jgi:hypothetical protein
VLVDYLAIVQVVNPHITYKMDIVNQAVHKDTIQVQIDV